MVVLPISGMRLAALYGRRHDMILLMPDMFPLSLFDLYVTSKNS